MDPVKGCHSCAHADGKTDDPACRQCWLGNGPDFAGWSPAEGAPVAVTTAGSKVKSDGGSTSYYKLPSDALDLQDLIEHKNMSFGRGNIFKATYRLGEKDAATEVYDLNKIIWFAKRRLAEIAGRRD